MIAIPEERHRIRNADTGEILYLTDAEEDELLFRIACNADNEFTQELKRPQE